MTKLKLLFLISFFIIVCCNTKKTESPFIDNLKPGDTLTLKSEGSSCGEFGGNVEKIMIIKKGSDLQAIYYEDEIISPCDSFPFLKRKILIEKSKILTKNDRVNVVKYIDNFLIITKPLTMPCYPEFNYEIITKDTNITYWNCENNWWDFLTLKHELFDK